MDRYWYINFYLITSIYKFSILFPYFFPLSILVSLFLLWLFFSSSLPFSSLSPFILSFSSFIFFPFHSLFSSSFHNSFLFYLSYFRSDHLLVYLIFFPLISIFSHLLIPLPSFFSLSHLYIHCLSFFYNFRFPHPHSFLLCFSCKFIFSLFFPSY